MRVALAVAVALGLASASLADQAQASMRKYPEIAPQNLDAALKSFAEERGLAMIYRTEVVSNISTAGASADMSLDDALRALLSGTDLTYKFLDEKTVAIVPAPAAPVQSSDGESNSGKDSTEKQGLTQVVVTAQKRQERLQDVPISVAVIGGDSLDKQPVEGVAEALNRLPGVSTTAFYLGGGTQVAVRGVTASLALASGTSPIAYYLDSMPFGLASGAVAPDLSAYDLDRVEVLRGPQGTLYGASAAAGVVRVLTKDADLDKFEFKARTGGSFTDAGGGNYRGDVAVNAPIVDGKLAVRAVVGYQNVSGWIDRPNETDANSGELQNYRLKVNAQPTEDLSVGLSAWVSRTDFDAPPTGLRDRTNPSRLGEPLFTDYDVYALRAGYNFSSFTVENTASYLRYENHSYLDYEAAFNLADTRLETDNVSNVFSDEINFSSKLDGPWKWTAGAIYRDGNDLSFQLRRQYLAISKGRNTNKSTAVYGELTRLFLENRLELTGGLRYYDSEVGTKEISRLTNPPPDQLTSNTANFHKVSPRGVLTWHASNEATFYASYGEGFRSGAPISGLIKVAAPYFPDVEPDNLKNFEVGAKGVLWDGRMTVDAAVFYMDWQKVQQVLTVNAAPPGAAPINVATLVNSKSASGAGVDLSIGIQPIERLEIGLDLGWNGLENDTPVYSNGLLLFDKGDRLNLSPEYTAGVDLSYVMPFGTNGYRARFSTSGNYISAQQSRIISGSRVLIGKGDSMLTARASCTVDSPSNWSASLFVENLTNNKGSPSVAAIGVPGWDLRIRPRTAGVQVDFHF